MSDEEKKVINSSDDEESWNFGKKHTDKTAVSEKTVLKEADLADANKEDVVSDITREDDNAEDELPVLDFSDIDFGEEPVTVNNKENIFNKVFDYLKAFFNRPLKKWVKVTGICVVAVLLLVFFILFTKPGHAIVTNIVTRIAFSQAQRDTDNNERLDEDEVISNSGGDLLVRATSTPTPSNTPSVTEKTDEPDVSEAVITTTPEPTVPLTPTPTPWIYPEYEEDNTVVNVLLIGVENMKKEITRGRSDAMLVATVDKKTGEMKITSLMRDMYVEIPGYDPNKLNAAFAFGGPKLLMETIELNFGLKCDSYIQVSFEGFESIIDYLGGIEISLTDAEAKYLNETDYISKWWERNVVPGEQLMTGAQALGFCRVRYVPAANGNNSDFGRTYRQRVVIDKIFEKCKTSGYTKLLGAMNEMMRYVTVPEGFEKFASDLLLELIEVNGFDLSSYKLQTYRIPAYGHYTAERVRSGEVIVFDAETPDLLHEFLYGTNE